LLALLQPSLGSLTRGDVLEAIHPADESAGFIAQRVEIGENGETASVWALDHELAVADRAASLEQLGHRSFVEPKRFSVGPIGFECPRETMFSIGDNRGLAPELGGAIVVLDEITFGITDADADGKPLKEAVAQLKGVLQGAGDDRLWRSAVSRRRACHVFPRSLAQEGWMSPKMRYRSKGSTLARMGLVKP